MPTKKAAPPAPQFIAVRAFRSDKAAESGKRGRRLVIDTQTGTVSALASAWNAETHESAYTGGMAPVANLQAQDVDGLTVALSGSKTPVVLTDDALTEYVNAHEGTLPLEGLAGEGLDDFVDQRPAAVERRQKIADREAAKAEQAA